MSSVELTDPRPSAGSLTDWARARKLVIPLAGVLALALLPLVMTSAYQRNLAILVLLFAIVASSWDITMGLGGVFNMAHVALFGLGAYSSAIFTTRTDLSPWLGLLVGVLAAVVGSVLSFLPCIRLRGIYVALVTFAFSQLVLYVVISQSELTGGYLGLAGVPSLELFGLSFASNNRIGYYYFAAFLFVASLWVMRLYMRSKYGLGLVALRDFEEYAVSRGVSVGQHRLGAFMFSAAFAGLAGAVYGHYLGVVSMEVFDFSSVTLLMSMILVGGIGTLYGPALGSAIFTVGTELLVGLDVWRFMIMAVAIIVTMRFFPEGAWPWISRGWKRVMIRFSSTRSPS